MSDTCNEQINNIKTYFIYFINKNSQEGQLITSHDALDCLYGPATEI